MAAGRCEAALPRATRSALRQQPQSIADDGVPFPANIPGGNNHPSNKVFSLNLLCRYVLPKQTTKSTKYQERLTPDNAALLLIDHQVGLFTGVRDIPVAELKHNVVALAKAIKVLSVPIIVTATSPE